jgi:ubiquinone biosynthesis accessory factor UbiJ
LSDAPSRSGKATLGWPFSWALNRLLGAEPWARERLAPFAGAILEVRADPLPRLSFVVLPGGLLEPHGGQPSSTGGEPALTITLTPEVLTQLPRGEEHVLRAVRVEGDPALAAAVRTLLRHLRWDFEEDLSRLIGDVAAHRVAGALRELAAWQADATRRLAESMADYAVEERRVLVGRAEMERFADAVARLRDDLERLEKRIAQLG